MHYGLAAVALAAIASPAAAPRAFDWMVGRWCTTVEQGVQTCESWTGWSEGRMRGESRTIKAGKVVETETTTIRTAGGKAAYDASPGGAPIVTFIETSRGPSAIVFANAGHDYPQRVRYWREGPDLLAEIALADGSKAMRWRYRRVR
jgi:hypothetical protein